MEVVFAIFIIAVFICILALTPFYLRSRERMRLIELVRGAADAGQPIPPEVLSTLASEPKPQRPSHIRDTRRGIVLLSLALAIVIIAFALSTGIHMTEGGRDELNEATGIGLAIAGFAAIPGCIGLAFLLLGLTGKKTSEA